MKKQFCVLMAILLAATLFSAAAEEHAHLPNGTVFLDTASLWEMCDCGEKMLVCTHQLTEDVCTNCGAEFYHYEDGETEITLRDQKGNVVRQISYSPDGQLLVDHRWELGYDENGGIIFQAMYINDMLSMESQYGYMVDGTPLETVCNIYDEDGSYISSTWNEYGLPARTAYYAFDGSLLAEEVYEYTVDENALPKTGKYYAEGRLLCEYEYASFMEEGLLHIQETAETFYFEDGSVEQSKFNEQGDTIYYLFVDNTGAALIEESIAYEYGEDGELLSSKKYSAGKLYMECRYGMDANGWTYLYSETLYSEDGTYCLSQYDEMGNPLLEAEYAADGALMLERTFEYDYLDDPLWYTEQRVYENGVLAILRQFSADEEGYYYLKTEKQYAPDGAVSILEYAPDGTLIEE